jgi:S-adenosylmethionine-diacylglycerol 3-amino-3-carboxypropyl transferase
MYSAFYNVALDRVRYSLVWEDSFTVLESLDIKPADKLLMITSGGTNVLNALLTPAQHITAIDLNPIQNQLLRLQLLLIRDFPYPIFRKILGFEGAEAVALAFEVIKPHLSNADASFWEVFLDTHPNGILTSGKLEEYIGGFYATLDTTLQTHLKTLVAWEDLASQKLFFQQYIHIAAFREAFTEYFNELNLSKGRDPALFQYAEESAGDTFYARLVLQAETTLLKDNFYARFFFFGLTDLPEEILPPCYQPQNYQRLRENLAKIEIIQGEAVAYLLTEAGKKITKASLSNIFEYTTHAEFYKVCTELAAHNPNFAFVYWNLLQEQTIPQHPRLKTTQMLPKPQTCFYFKNTKLVEILGAVGE